MIKSYKVSKTINKHDSFTILYPALRRQVTTIVLKEVQDTLEDSKYLDLDTVRDIVWNQVWITIYG